MKMDRLDVLFGGYNEDLHRGAQLLINNGNREFLDQTQRRLGVSAWSRYEGWHVEHRLYDFNNDGTIDIVPQQSGHRDVGNVLAWLNDGTGHFVTLKTSIYSDTDALFRFADGIVVREGSEFKVVEFFLYDDGQTDGLFANAAIVEEPALITLVE